MKDKSKVLKLCVIMLAILGIYPAIALIFVGMNSLSKEWYFAIENRSMGVFLHILFVAFVHILESFLFIACAIGVRNLNKNARKIAIIITGLNIFTVFTKTHDVFMFSIKMIVVSISLLTFSILLKREVREEL